MSSPKTFDELSDEWLNEAVMYNRDDSGYAHIAVMLSIAFSLQAISEKMDKIERRLK